MDGIFISYRRSDAPAWAGRLADVLTTEFGRDQVFIDIDDIPLGADFLTHINRTLEACRIVIVIIGPRWSGAEDGDGRRRIDDEHDFVALEIEQALVHRVLVIPVLVDGARMPQPIELPERLRPLARINALELAHESFRYGVQDLVRRLHQHLDQPTPVPSAPSAADPATEPALDAPRGTADPPPPPAPPDLATGRRVERPESSTESARRPEGLEGLQLPELHAWTLVHGIICARGHLNPPRMPECLTCGLSMIGTPSVNDRPLIRGPRPPLGELILDPPDGERLVVDRDFVIGRDPSADPAVAQGEAAPVFVAPADRTVSRIHARIVLSDWDAHLEDTGSANGTFLARPHESQWTRVPPGKAVILERPSHFLLGSALFLFRAPDPGPAGRP